MTQLVLASGNPGKLRELVAILDDLGYQLTPQSEFNVSEVAETGTTFVENAIIKARHAATQTGLPAVADDSGILHPIEKPTALPAAADTKRSAELTYRSSNRLVTPTVSSNPRLASRVTLRSMILA